MSNVGIDIRKTEDRVINPSGPSAFLNIIDIDSTATPLRLRFLERNYSKERPNNPGRLFYKDFFKLRPNTELVLHFHRELLNIQFISIHRNTQKGQWGIKYRLENGNEEIENLCYLGATKNRNKEWVTERWITLRKIL